MVDAVDSKSTARKGVGVQVPLRAPIDIAEYKTAQEIYSRAFSFMAWSEFWEAWRA
jgi:hypothetical protein